MSAARQGVALGSAPHVGRVVRGRQGKGREGGGQGRRQAGPLARQRESYSGTTRSRPPATPPSAKACIAQNAPAPPHHVVGIPLLLLRSRGGRIECTSRIGGGGRARGWGAGERGGPAKPSETSRGGAAPARPPRTARRAVYVRRSIRAAAKSVQGCHGAGAGRGVVVEWWWKRSQWQSVMPYGRTPPPYSTSRPQLRTSWAHDDRSLNRWSHDRQD